MLLPALLCYGGFTALCLSMERHYSDLLAGTPSLRRRRAFKAGGWLLLAVSAWAAVSAEGWTMGLVKWSAVLMASAVLLVFLLPYRPRWVLTLAGTALLLSPLAAWL
ncbi:DUF3325 domain-containing protein [Pseudomonas syringae]|nr:DUF3325 domain-containing protein [Pseudomonas syringae]MBD8574880.1 DUF3325 domain-containing protein [Pseudomonas syringae]MBD8789680.1 DUF3325 domain-containing protein [Pseudomonas syringae]MBD8800869.1 DUF3325 domain-containing protein [Pseudomonas syringae]MBD8812250.1 DUF3325 domain-containing protein [Pseudomonas syringae]